MRLLFTVREVCALSGISRSALYVAMANGTCQRVTRFGRSVRVSREALAAWIEQRLAAGLDWRDHDLTVASSVGTPLWETLASSDLHAVFKAAGLPRRRLHDLRHTYATMLFALGKHSRAVRDLLGHSKVSVTLATYTAPVPTVLREAAEGLLAALRTRPSVTANG
jgi:excisionase family DNA binding protein